jgi:hypothetical protein
VLSTVGRTSYIYRPFSPIALGLYRPIATGFISLNHRLRKPEVIGFVSLIDHYDVQFKVVGIGLLTPPTPTKVAPTAPFLTTVDAPWLLILGSLAPEYTS